jgi:hypothetical protein
MLHVWALVGDNAFTFTFSARPALYEEYLPTIEKMLNSFVFLNPPTPPTTTQVTEQEENTLTPTTSQPLQRTRSENTSQLSNPLIPSASSNSSGQNTIIIEVETNKYQQDN